MKKILIAALIGLVTCSVTMAASTIEKPKASIFHIINLSDSSFQVHDLPEKQNLVVKVYDNVQVTDADNRNFSVVDLDHDASRVCNIIFPTTGEPTVTSLSAPGMKKVFCSIVRSGFWNPIYNISLTDW